MSEYQYYEFITVNRKLSSGDKTALRNISSRARISSTRFVNEYNYGDFKGDPVKLLQRYFDLHVYWANWGTRVLGIRLPSGVFSKEDLEPYLLRGTCELHTHHKTQVLMLTSQDEDGWDESWDEDWMSVLRGVHRLLERGDTRLFYLGWLAGAAYEASYEGEILDAPEPPVPSGLGKLPAALESLVEFLRIPAEWLEQATRRSGRARTVSRRDALKCWVKSLSEEDRSRALVEVLDDPDGDARTRWMARFQRSDVIEVQTGNQTRRTVGDMYDVAMGVYEAEAEAKKTAARQAREDVFAELATRAGGLWGKVEALVEERNDRAYKRAVGHLVELRELAEHEGQVGAFLERLAPILNRHSRKRNFRVGVERAQIHSPPVDEASSVSLDDVTTARLETVLQTLEEGFGDWEIGDDLSSRAREICRQVISTRDFQDGHPETHAASAFYCAARELDAGVTQRDAADTFGVSTAGVSRLYRRYLDALE